MDIRPVRQILKERNRASSEDQQQDVVVQQKAPSPVARVGCEEEG